MPPACLLQLLSEVQQAALEVVAGGVGRTGAPTQNGGAHSEIQSALGMEKEHEMQSPVDPDPTIPRLDKPRQSVHLSEPISCCATWSE